VSQLMLGRQFYLMILIGNRLNHAVPMRLPLEFGDSNRLVGRSVRELFTENVLKCLVPSQYLLLGVDAGALVAGQRADSVGIGVRDFCVDVRYVSAFCRATCHGRFRSTRYELLALPLMGFGSGGCSITFLVSKLC